ncbi:TPA: hypothetical protein EYP38_05045 [Candidatus Micrarchaeota archaeon]|nr:hypothetical protein [Candidatus Micrarchaeota archaeon]
MEKRKVSYPLYITAFLLSAAVFAIGVFVGMVVDSANMASLNDRVESLSQRSTSVQLLLLMEGNSSAYCPVFRSELETIDADIERIGYELTFMEEKRQAYDPELKRQYFLLEAGSYALAKKVNQICGSEEHLLLYFYSNEDCDSCLQQGEEILNARNSLADAGVTMRIYSFDGDLGSPVAEALMAQHGVTGYPSVVIDGVTHSGYADVLAIRELVSHAG